uniref:Diacylglycerol lipase-beta n=1 Tax=Echeneis naucrates TaxID=173247 RepID=A0A665VGC5_ECHNA
SVRHASFSVSIVDCMNIWARLGACLCEEIKRLRWFTFKMPGMVVFGRRWGIASDDLVFPGSFELFVRVLWWIGALILYIHHRGNFDCNGRILHTYLVGLLVVLGLIILTLSAIVYVSAQGTITNPGPRRSIPVLVYLRALLYIPELVWACLGAVWVSDGKGCDPATVGAVIAAVIASWIILLFTGLGVVFVFDPLGNPRPQQAVMEPLGVREEGTQLFSTARSLATKVWESRLRLLCCCLPQDENYRAAFSSIAQLFSGFFSDTDLVPSDIAAGLALLHQEQDKMERSRDPDIVVALSPSSPTGGDLETELEKAAHCMQFAAAAYGWPLFIYSNPFTGPCKLSGDCCRSQAAEYEIVGGDNLGCHFSSILHSTGLQYRDFIYVSFHNQIYEIPFFVALDHKREAVLVAVRGTLSLKDVLTDLSAECEDLPVDGVSGASYGHKGISQAAGYIYKKLVNDGILNQAFSVAPEYKLVITGHSLGAGTASILAILLRNSFPNLQCYETLIKGFSQEREEELSQPLVIHNSSSYQSLGSDDSPVHKATHLPLFPPGRILYITEDGPPRRHCFSQVKYQAEWASEATFMSILISPSMLGDHMPDIKHTYRLNVATCVSRFSTPEPGLPGPGL